jgi:hypothetical protein
VSGVLAPLDGRMPIGRLAVPGGRLAFGSEGSFYRFCSAAPKQFRNTFWKPGMYQRGQAEAQVHTIPRPKSRKKLALIGRFPQPRLA